MPKRAQQKPPEPNLPLALVLPYPPSDNVRFVGKTKRLSRVVNQFRDVEVTAVRLENHLRTRMIAEPVRVVLYSHAAHSRRDLANCQKVLYDALEKCKFIENDRLIQGFQGERGPSHPSDAIWVELWPLAAEPMITRRLTLEARMAQAFWQDRLLIAEHARKAIANGGRIVKSP